MGSWKLVDECPVKLSSCPEAKIAVSSNLPGEVTLMLGADSRYVRKTVAPAGNAVVTLPASCLTPPQQTCADRDANARTMATQLPQAYAGASCSMDGTSCACTTSYAPINHTEYGTYGLIGTQISFAESGSDFVPFTQDFCVDGNTLHLFLAGAEYVWVRQ